MNPELGRRNAGGTGTPARASTMHTVRWTNVVLGAWLFVSAFLWKHTPTSFTNTWFTGAVIAAVAVGAMAAPALRYMNAVVAVYLFWASIFVPHIYSATGWHNALVAVAVFFTALAPRRVYGTHTGISGVPRRAEV